MNRAIWTPPPRNRLGFYYLAFVGSAIVVLFVAAVVGILTDNAQNREQDRLLACFDDYAKASNSTSVAVREASVKVSEAQANEGRIEEVWTGLLEKAFTFPLDSQTPEARELVADFAEATTQLREAKVEKRKADDALAQAREDNPVPDPPSEFCG